MELHHKTRTDPQADTPSHLVTLTATIVDPLVTQLTFKIHMGRQLKCNHPKIRTGHQAIAADRLGMLSMFKIHMGHQLNNLMTLMGHQAVTPRLVTLTHPTANLQVILTHLTVNPQVTQ